MEITNIDFSSYDENKVESLIELGGKIYEALSTTGFMTVSNIGISEVLRSDIFDASKAFFSSEQQVKDAVGYRSADENFGYQGIKKEALDPSKPADIKEAFTMRNAELYFDDPSRWPSPEFRDLILKYYDEVYKAGRRLMRVFSAVLKTDDTFFIERHQGNNVTLRLLHYPSYNESLLDEEQLGAGAHTDYGMITFLFQDGIEGLEVKDKDGNWLAVPADTNKIIINTGDLMHRWTNDIFRSTPHRVIPKTGKQDRYSIAMFFDPDEDVMIETIPSCISESRPNRYSPISAGEHILQKIRATHATAY